MYVCMYVCIYIYIYIYRYTHVFGMRPACGEAVISLIITKHFSFYKIFLMP